MEDLTLGKPIQPDSHAWPDGHPLPKNLLVGAQEMAGLIETGQTFAFEQRLRTDFSCLSLDDFRGYLDMINENLTQYEKRVDKKVPKLDLLDKIYSFYLPVFLVEDGKHVGTTVLDQYSKSGPQARAYESFRDDFFKLNSCLESKNLGAGQNLKPVYDCRLQSSAYESEKAMFPVELHLE